MLTIGSLAFLSPWLLLTLLALPALWYLLRATPPAPGRISFPGVRLLLGLEDPEKTPERTPLWLLILRMAVAAAAIIAFSDPILNPRKGLEGEGPVLLIMDGGWASAPDWDARREAALAELDRADRAGRPVSLHILSEPPREEVLDLRPAADWRGVIEALTPAAWAPQRLAHAVALEGMAAPSGLDAVWITDGLAHGDEGALAQTLTDLGGLRIMTPERAALGLSAPRLEEGRLTVSALRAQTETEAEVLVALFGRAEEGGERRLGTLAGLFEAGAAAAAMPVELPLELRNQITRFAIVGEEGAGATVLTDESVRRRRVGVVAGGTAEDAPLLVSELHYLRTALGSFAEVAEGTVEELLLANPDALVLADVGTLTPPEREAMIDWIETGGLLIRFAGPRMAKGADLAAGGPATLEEDPLLPVSIRAGGRAVGGAMAWGAPQRIRDFGRESPFFGLTAPREVTVTRQVLARLGPELAQRTWAALEDGTPLVTAAERGAGRVVLFHVTANTDWSDLQLSGLFVDMMARLVALSGAGGSGDAPPPEEPLRQVASIDGFGRVAAATGDLIAVPASRLGEVAGPDAPPGLYSGETARVAFNVFQTPEPPLLADPAPLSAIVETLGTEEERRLAPWFLGLAILLMAADLLAALWLSGRRFRFNPGAAGAALILLAAPQVDAQETDVERALRAANETVLAYVVTGDPRTDQMAEAGLRGLSRVLAARTAIEPDEPMAVDLELDDLTLHPLIYWAVTPEQPTPSDEAAARLNEYMRTGGMIVIDTRDAHVSSPGAPGPNTRALRRLTRDLDLPPLERVGQDHVLTRTFYLLDRFPGRWTGGDVWVERSRTGPLDAAEGLIADPNDGVSPVVIGAADWSAAWAVGEDGDFLAPVGRANNARQREMAFRFGVNVVMYAMTGNYKSDQVHVPALLERLDN